MRTTEVKRKVYSIWLDENTYKLIQQLVGKGKVGTFIRNATLEKLSKYNHKLKIKK